MVIARDFEKKKKVVIAKVKFSQIIFCQRSQKNTIGDFLSDFLIKEIENLISQDLK